MKKIYLLGLLAASFAVNAQAPQTGDMGNQAKKTSKQIGDYTPASPVVNRQANNSIGLTGKGYGKNSTWVVVGQTEFDRQTNASTYRRIITYPNGKISVIWTTSTDGPATGFRARGTGYNHFDGSAWGTVSKNRIENRRTGYPNFDYDPISGSEIILSHKVDSSGFSGGMLYNTNGSIGSNTWTGVSALDTSKTLPGALWPRTAVSGDYMIVIASFTDSSSQQPGRVVLNGVRAPQVYSRLNLRTNVWDVVNQTLPGYDSSRHYSGGGDNYAIDAKGNNVAILMGGLTDDIALWKSADNGGTWTKTIIDSFPVAAFNFRQLVLDTPYSTDGAMSVTLDATGKAHCFWSYGRMFDNDTTNGNTTYSYFPGQNTIAHWYEGRPDSLKLAGFSPEDPTDADEVLTIGEVINDRTRYGNLSKLATAPSAVISGDTVYVVYQGLTDNDLDQQGQAFYDIYVAASINNGLTWLPPVNITATMGLNEEQTFASVAADCRTNLHLTFMNTKLQGFYDATNNAEKVGPYDIVYYQIPVEDIFDRNVVGLNETNDLFSLDQNFPNPFDVNTTVPVKLNRSSDVKISVVNMIGQTVYSNTFANSPAGVNNFDVNMASAKAGIYFYTVEAGEFKVTRKFIVE
jgi:hypothetical protein